MNSHRSWTALHLNSISPSHILSSMICRESSHSFLQQFKWPIKWRQQQYIQFNLRFLARSWGTLNIKYLDTKLVMTENGTGDYPFYNQEISNTLMSPSLIFDLLTKSKHLLDASVTSTESDIHLFFSFRSNKASMPKVNEFKLPAHKHEQ